jgi:hypothetical protein
MSKLMGFECVVRALRSGYEVRRPKWKENAHIRYDQITTKQILLQDGKDTSFYVATSEDILAQDWESYRD